MNTSIAGYETPAGLLLVTKAYERFLLIGFALGPVALIAYLFVFQDPQLRFENHAFH